jgi:hypothetical protein
MAFTASDLTNIDAAITAYYSGSRAEQVSKGDGMIKYATMSISDMLKLRALIQQELGISATRTYARQGGRCK